MSNTAAKTAASGERATTPGSDASTIADSAKSSGTPWLPIFLAAIAFAVLYAIVSVVTYLRADDEGMSETIWSRLIFVLHGFEAIAFTAVGWLFGREVHRGEAKQAKEEAKDAKAQAGDMKEEVAKAREESAAARDDERTQAERAADAETRGWRLAEAVRAQSAASSTNPADTGEFPADGSSGNESSPAGRRGVPLANSDHIRDLADSLFPPG